ncbi:MAG: hypothetical protein JW909_08020 [Planctomycetes bacterium]|nr:hypothetical protein [Planctomycetota bacterium]
MRKLLSATVLLALVGCGADGVAGLNSGSLQAGMVPAVTPAHVQARALPAYWLDRTHQKLTMDYVFGDNLGQDLVDLRGLDNDTSMVSFSYRYNFGRGVKEVYSDYEPVPAFWFGAGFGTLGFDFIFHFEYDMTKLNTGMSLLLGRNATLEFEGTMLSVDDWPAILETYVDARSTLTFYPTEDLFIGIGYKFDWYGNQSSDTYFSNMFAEIGYLIGRAETGVELLFNFRQKGENGTDDEANYVGGGLKWHMGRAVALGLVYEDVSGDLNESQALNLGLWISPGQGVHIKLGLGSTHIDATDEDETRLSFGVSYAF